MRLTDEQYEDIKIAVITTFLEYDIKCIPISAFEMAVKMELSVIPYSALDTAKKEAALAFSADGFSLETKDNQWLIFYNDCKNYGRINQTIMHEIGHYVLGHKKGEEEEEAEAKFFAKYALAPPPLIHAVCSEVSVDIVMNKFDISRQAARIACGYYAKWLKYGAKDYTDYEEKMMRLFEVA